MSTPPDPPPSPKPKKVTSAEKILTQEEALAIEIKRLEVQEQRLMQEGKFIEALQKTKILEQERGALVGEAISQYKDMESVEAIINRVNDAIEAGGDLNLQYEASSASAKAELIKLKGVLEDLNDASESTAESIKKAEQELFKFAKKTKELSSTTKEVATSIGGVDSSIKSLIGGLSMGLTSTSGFASNIIKLRAEMKILEKNNIDVTTSMIAGRMALETMIGVFNKLGSEVATLAENLSKAAGELDKLGGSTQNTFSDIADLSGGLLRLGISEDEVAKTTGALMNNTALLGEKISDAEKESVKLGIKMVSLGVDAKHLSDTINVLSTNYGMSFKESTSFYESIILDSKLAGQSVAELSTAFSQASDRLYSAATSSDQLKKMFAELNLTSRELGVEISDILSLTEKFDKFADAADMAGKLNAQFGLNLSMSKLQRASDEERLEIIRQSFLAQGIQVDQLSLMNKKFITSTLGVKDQATMLRLLGKRRKVENDSVTNLNELLTEGMGAWDKLKFAMKEAALVLEPLAMGMILIVEVMAAVIGGIAGAINELDNWVGTTIKWVLSGITLAGVLGLIWGSLWLLAGAAPKIAEKMGEAFEKLATGTKSLFEALTWENIKKLGAVMLIFAVSVGIAAFGLSYLAEAMKDMSGETAWAFVAAIAIIMVSMIAFIAFMGYFGPALATALVTAGSGLLYFGGALFIVGAGLALMFYSAAGLAKELGNLADGSFNALIEGLIALSLVSSPLADLKDDLKTLNDMANDIDGMVIMKSDGGSRTIMMASESIIKGKTEGSIDVNVHISMDDKINVANEIKVYLDSKELTDAVMREAKE